jgi:hypothetical protein
MKYYKIFVKNRARLVVMSELFYVGLIGITLLLSTVLFVYMHEIAHVAIFDYAGVESHTEWSLNGGLTYADTDFKTIELKQQAYIGHGINESVGYQVLPVGIMICTTIMLSTLYLGGKK